MVFIPPRVNTKILMPCELLQIVIAFAPLFSKPVFRHVQVLLTGAVLAVNRRTVSEILRVTGRGTKTNFQNYHRVLNRAEWSGLAASRILLQMLVTVFVPAGTIVIGLDETIERRSRQEDKSSRHLPRCGAVIAFARRQMFGFAVVVGDAVNRSWLCRASVGVAVSHPVVSE